MSTIDYKLVTLFVQNIGLMMWSDFDDNLNDLLWYNFYSTTSDCPKSFTYIPNPSLNKCYYLVYYKLSWADARKHCKVYHSKSRLLVINNNREQFTIVSHFLNPRKGTNFKLFLHFLTVYNFTFHDSLQLLCMHHFVCMNHINTR